MAASKKSLAEEVAEICDLDVPLRRRLELFAQKRRAEGSPFADASDRLVARLNAGGIPERAPRVGETMPGFLLPDQRGRLVSLDDLVAEGPVILSFNRGHWCPFCQIELTSLARAHAELAGLGGQVISLMPDRQAFVARLPPAVLDRLVVLSDLDNAYALSLGLVMWLGDELQALMRGGGLSLEEVHGNAGWLVPMPATFVLDHAARVVARCVESDFRTRLDIADIRRALTSVAARTG